MIRRQSFKVLAYSESKTPKSTCCFIPHKNKSLFEISLRRFVSDECNIFRMFSESLH